MEINVINMICISHFSVSKMNFHRWVIREATKAIPIALPDIVLQNFGKPSPDLLLRIVNPIDSPTAEVIDESDVATAVHLSSVWITVVSSFGCPPLKLQMEEFVQKGKKPFDSPDFKMLYDNCGLEEGDYLEYVYHTAFDLLQFMFHRQSFKESLIILRIADYFATTLVKQHNRRYTLYSKY